MTLRPLYDPTLCSTSDAHLLNHAWHDLKAMARDLEAMPDEWCRALDAWQQPANRAPMSAGGRPVGSVSDTTGNLAVEHLNALSDALALAQAVLVARSEILRIRQALGSVRVKADAHELAQAKDAARCTGGEGQPGGLVWGRPDCRELVVHLGPRLCTACYARRRRWEQAGRPDERRPHGGPRLPALPVDYGAIAGAYRLVAEFENVREAS